MNKFIREINMITKCFIVVLFAYAFIINLGCKDNSVIPINEADTTSHQFTWEKDTIGEWQSVLYDVWGTNESAYAVGFIYLSYSPYEATNIIHWNGSKWEPINYLQGDITSIFGFDQNDIWICGSWRVDNNLYPLFAHWDGENWKTQKLTELGQPLAIWGTNSNNLYACGSNGLIMHYDGHNWIRQESGTTFLLRNIWGIDNTNIFIAGYQESLGEGVLLKFNGSSWQTMIKGTSEEGDSTLYGDFEGVWCINNDNIIVVGALCYEEFAGKWKLSDIPYNYPPDNFIGLAAMRDVNGSKENNIFICGDYNLIIHWNGKSWHIYSQFFNKSKPANLYGSWVTEKSAFFVGSENSKAVVYRCIK
jgi:hypothetical protein